MRLHHLAILTAELDAVLPFWRDVLGLELRERKVVSSESAEIAFLSIGDSLIELVQPMLADTKLAHQASQPGTKMHHLCLEVEDLDICLSNLRGAGVKIINETVKIHEDGTRYIFIHPRSTGGVLLELYETTPNSDG